MEAVMGVLLGIGLGAACGLAALVTLSVATLLEIAAYYIPVIDHTLDVLGAPAAIVAGTILAAGFIGSMDPMLKWGLAAIAGGGAAGIIHGGMAATGGLGNSVVTTAETASASIVAVLACVLPVAAVLLAAAAIYFLVRTGLVLKRKLRRSPGGPEGEI